MKIISLAEAESCEKVMENRTKGGVGMKNIENTLDIHFRENGARHKNGLFLFSLVYSSLITFIIRKAV